MSPTVMSAAALAVSVIGAATALLKSFATAAKAGTALVKAEDAKKQVEDHVAARPGGTA